MSIFRYVDAGSVEIVRYPFLLISRQLVSKQGCPVWDGQATYAVYISKITNIASKFYIVMILYLEVKMDIVFLWFVNFVSNFESWAMITGVPFTNIYQFYPKHG